MISEDTILEIRRSADIYQIISSYMPLKRSGSNYKALCPFHEEKTPSFMVSPKKQMYKCFGCGKGGNVINFIMEYEKLGFQEALKLLADKTGIKIKYQDTGQKSSGKEDLYKLMDWAAGIYRKTLLESDNAAVARKYLKERGVEKDTQEIFRIGFAPNSWNFILSEAKKYGFSAEMLLACGLAAKGEDGTLYDRFRNRIMIPIIDQNSRAIAFGGRAVDPTQDAKYINSPETPIYSKGRNVFGLNLMKSNKPDSETLYVVEGYLDVILPYQNGFRGFVAILGTALTHDQATLLKRYSSRINLVFDPDSAGMKAFRKGLEMLLDEDIDLNICLLPKDHDPADCVSKLGKDVFTRVLDAPEDLFEFLMEVSATGLNLNKETDKLKLIDNILMTLSEINNTLKRDLLLQRLASKFSIDERKLRARMSQIKVATRVPEQTIQPKRYSTSEEKISAGLIEVMLTDNNQIPYVRQQLTTDAFPTEDGRLIASKIYELHDRMNEVDATDLLAIFQENEKARQMIMQIVGKKEELLGVTKEERSKDSMSGVQGATMVQGTRRLVDDYIRGLKRLEAKKTFHDVKMRLRESSNKEEVLRELQMLKKIEDHRGL